MVEKLIFKFLETIDVQTCVVNNQLMAFKGDIENTIVWYCDKKLHRFIIEERHRQDRKEVYSSHSKTKAEIMFCAVVDNFFNRTIDITVQQQLKLLLQNNNFEAVERVLARSLKIDSYSLNEIKEDKVSLLLNSEVADLYFGEEKILSEISLLRGYISLYNYSKKIERGKEVYQELISKNNDEVSLSEFLKIYITSSSY